ncbi:hypothetical protein DYB28_014283 [Aphanomyces astaci]|uniref:Rrn7/TAF1B N-terminal cyclin domain-containing protein n=1 Tax=Aphanomyces astaci TaxID=112090 RepID=A0A9X8DXV2_APHAT|nr:hypothetical protein DYB28_014283 [Aphanomyces astaci]
MDSTLKCRTCGAAGEWNFSKNDLGESVCNLCGTQSFQQSRNETQDDDDAFTFGARTKRIRSGGRREPKQSKLKRKRQLITLDNCLHVVQSMLHIQAQALARLVHDPELPATVQSLWFHFLRMWDVSGSRPLLNVFLDFSSAQAADSGYETDWNLHLKGTQDAKVFSKFSYRHLLGLLYLACRVRQLGVLTSDIFFWVSTGQLPFANVLAQLPPDLQASVDPVRGYFNAKTKPNTVCASVVAQHATYLHYHLDLKLPPFNSGLACVNLCQSFQFPPAVWVHHTQLMAEYYRHSTAQVMDPQHLHHPYIQCEVDFIGALVAALKMTPRWNVWQYNNVRPQYNAPQADDRRTPLNPLRPNDLHEPPPSMVVSCFPDDGTPVLRSHLPALVDLCRQSLDAKKASVKLPPALEAHVQALDRLGRDTSDISATAALNPVAAFAPHYDRGVPVPDPTTGRWPCDDVAGEVGDEEGDDQCCFYPIYQQQLRTSGLGAWHAPLEYVVDMLAKYMDVPPGVVRDAIETIDRTISTRHVF